MKERSEFECQILCRSTRLDKLNGRLSCFNFCRFAAVSPPSFFYTLSLLSVFVCFYAFRAFAFLFSASLLFLLISRFWVKNFAPQIFPFPSFSFSFFSFFVFLFFFPSLFLCFFFFYSFFYSFFSFFLTFFLSFLFSFFLSFILSFFLSFTLSCLFPFFLVFFCLFSAFFP